ncbi:MAG: hypothetical protein ACREXT_11740, partial [Gammaproteobacteria bacterium]
STAMVELVFVVSLDRPADTTCDRDETRMNGIAALGCLGLGVADLAAWEDFAKQILGLRPIRYASCTT